jgi:hypothetical protein
MAQFTDNYENDASEKLILSGSTSTCTEPKNDPFNATDVYADESSYVEVIDICHMPPHAGRNRAVDGKQ